MNTARENNQKNKLETTRTRQARVPKVDIYENDQELLLLADLPGVASEQLNLAIEPPELRIEATGSETGPFARTFTIDERIAVSDVTAELKNGVLTIKLPKVASQKPRQIPIRASS
jgi:HSP20 family molecular chaperone IbpA